MLAFKLWPTPLPLCLSTILTKVSLKMPYSITSSCPTELSTQPRTCLESFVSAYQSQGQWLESRRWGLSLPAMLKNLALTVAEASVSSSCPFPPHCYQQDMPQAQAHQWNVLLELGLSKLSNLFSSFCLPSSYFSSDPIFFFSCMFKLKDNFNSFTLANSSLKLLKFEGCSSLW